VVCGVVVVGAVVLGDVGEIEDHVELLRLPLSRYVCTLCLAHRVTDGVTTLS